MGRAWRDRLRGLTSGVRAEPGIVALAAALGVAYAVYAVLRHVHFQTGLDLTIFDQAVWHLSRFEEPASTMKGVVISFVTDVAIMVQGKSVFAA